MNYRVIWRQRSMAYLDQIIFIAGEMAGGKGIIAAYKSINNQLGERPNDVGESRIDEERVFIVSPLAVFYEVFETSLTVMIYRVHYRGYPKHNV